MKNQRIIVEDRHVENDQYIRIEVYYNVGGMNYMLGKVVTRGYDEN